MAPAPSFNAYEKPPEAIREVYKRYQKLNIAELDTDLDLVDFKRGLTRKQQVCFTEVDHIPAPHTAELYRHFMTRDDPARPDSPNIQVNAADIPVFEHQGLRGLRILPSLLTPDVQMSLLSRLLHRDLSNEQHKTNIHLHYNVKYPTPRTGRTSQGHLSPERIQNLRNVNTDSDTPSFFTYNHDSSHVFLPKNRDIHKPITAYQFLEKKLRWITLGGQYDWTNKEYPLDDEPLFPEDIASLLQGIFPDMTGEAAIVNLYSPGDTLSLHRDVSEECDRGLVSISMGCDGIFVVGVQDDSEDGKHNACATQYTAIRLHSGDVVCMSGKARYAWHGVPQIVRTTCPDWLQDWPAMPEFSAKPNSDEDLYSNWRGWMQTKRINLNVRQLRD
ncbi:MAG: hypothetical protein M1827_007760 [Pycnora praestabilis]|nr:MAG: hypothetical protein M1827_007760 [Pycnora praestabilis]